MTTWRGEDFSISILYTPSGCAAQILVARAIRRKRIRKGVYGSVRAASPAYHTEVAGEGVRFAPLVVVNVAAGLDDHSSHLELRPAIFSGLDLGIAILRDV